MQYIISGKVIKGDGYGRKLGFPTVNLEVGEQKLPADGVYSGVAILEDKEYNSGIVIGPNGKAEAHMIGYSGDVYGKTVSLKLNKFLRGYIKFETEEELIEQIKEDIKSC